MLKNNTLKTPYSLLRILTKFAYFTQMKGAKWLVWVKDWDMQGNIFFPINIYTFLSLSVLHYLIIIMTRWTKQNAFIPTLLYVCIQKNLMEYLTGSILLALVSMTMQLLRDLIEETGQSGTRTPCRDFHWLELLQKHTGKHAPPRKRINKSKVTNEWQAF